MSRPVPPPSRPAGAALSPAELQQPRLLLFQINGAHLEHRARMEPEGLQGLLHRPGNGLGAGSLPAADAKGEHRWTRTQGHRAGCLFHIRSQDDPHLRRPRRERPSGRSPCIGKSLCSPTESPARRAADTRLAAILLSMYKPLHFAQLSTAKRPFTSVAVEMAAVPPVSRATRRARSLAPPTWPERSGTTQAPPSSTLTTAGSVYFSLTQGAMARTAIRRPPRREAPRSRQSALRPVGQPLVGGCPQFLGQPCRESQLHFLPLFLQCPGQRAGQTISPAGEGGEGQSHTSIPFRQPWVKVGS